MCQSNKLEWNTIDERWSCIWIKLNSFWGSSMGYQNDLQKYIVLVKLDLMHEYWCLEQGTQKSSVRRNNTKLRLPKIIDNY